MADIDEAAAVKISGADLHAFIESQRESGENLYGVVDAARDKALAFEGALRYGWELQWLFSEDTHQQMKDVAPYLVAITFESSYPYPESDYLDLWAERLGTSAGVLLLTIADPPALREHLHSIFVVADEAGDEYFFRYYDPRVLRNFLGTSTPEQEAGLFGPVVRIVMEAEEPRALCVCESHETGVVISEHSLAGMGRGWHVKEKG